MGKDQRGRICLGCQRNAHHLNNWLILTNEHFRSMENQYLCR
ncbi:DUF1289 domain-containing protein [Parabacteroides distasonis]|nr:DUF1289 domain-containing protein [Parabacteroides distasonis]